MHCLSYCTKNRKDRYREALIAERERSYGVIIVVAWKRGVVLRDR